MKDEILQPVHDDDIPRLMNVLESKFPHSAPVYNWLRVHENWKSEIDTIKVDILSPHGDWKLGSVVVLCRKLMLNEKFYMGVYADSDNIDELMGALRETSLITWSNLGILSEVVKPLYEPMKTLLAEKIKIAPWEDHCQLLYLSKEIAAKVAVVNPTDARVRVSRIDVKYLDYICLMYDYFCESFKPMIETILNYNHTIGVFEGDKLVTMAAEVERGGLGMVFTHPDYKNKGYATVAMTHLVRALGQAGINIHSSLKLENTTSMRLHQRAGFDTACGEVFFFDYLDHPNM